MPSFALKLLPASLLILESKLSALVALGLSVPCSITERDGIKYLQALAFLGLCFSLIQ